MTGLFRPSSRHAARHGGAGFCADLPLRFRIGAGDDPSAVFLPRRLCILTDRGLRDAIADQGYSRIYLNVPTGRYIQARATRGDWVYLLKVNVCTGLIVDRQRLRRAG